MTTAKTPAHQQWQHRHCDEGNNQLEDGNNTIATRATTLLQ
jgi:hypothetical protein